MQGKSAIPLSVDYSESKHEVLVSNIVDEVIPGVNWFVADFKNIISWIGQEEIVQSIVDASVIWHLINQLAVMMPWNWKSLNDQSQFGASGSKC